MNNPSNTFEFIRLYPNLASDPVVGKIGEIYWNTTTNSPRKCTNDSPVTWSEFGGENASVEYRSITSGEDSAKQLTLGATPNDPSKVLVSVIGGISQIYSVDYTVSGNVLDWNGLGLDGILTTGDILLILYWT